MDCRTVFYNIRKKNKTMKVIYIIINAITLIYCCNEIDKANRERNLGFTIFWFILAFICTHYLFIKTLL